MKKYQFQFSRNAEVDFAALSRAVQKRIFEKLVFFEETENPMLYAKKMQGMADLYRFRVGDYRVIVTQKNKDTIVILLVLKIGHRKEVYS